MIWNNWIPATKEISIVNAVTVNVARWLGERIIKYELQNK